MKNANSRKVLITILLIAVGMCQINQTNAQIKSGLYSHSLIFSINQEKKMVSGYLWRYIYNDDNPSLGQYQTCYLYFKGYYQNQTDSIPIDIYNYLDTIPTSKGNIYCEKNQIALQTNRNIISCMNAFDLTHGELFEFNRYIPILYCSRIKKEKSYFYSNKKTMTNKCISKGECISILDNAIDFYLVQYIDRTNKTIEGWIKKSDVE